MSRRRSTRVLWVSDDPAAPTGFGNITKAVGSGLAELGYEVSIFGASKDRPVRRGRPFTVFSGQGRAADGTVLLRTMRRVRPDVLVTLIQPEEAECMSEPAVARFRRAHRIPWVLYYTIDCDRKPQRLPACFIDALREADLTVTPSRFAQRVAKQSGINSRYLPAGVDTTLFCPPADKQEAKRALGYEKRFVVLCDARNQIRKLLPRALAIFARFAANKNDVVLHLHCDPYDPAARAADYCYHILHDVELLGLGAKVRFTRGMSIWRGLSLPRLAALYRAADVHLLTSFGEGFGLPTLQAAAAGVVPLAPSYAAHRELVQGHGAALRVRKFGPFGRGWRAAFVDVDDAVAQLEGFYRDRQLLAARSSAARRFAEAYDWQGIVAQWHQLLEREVPPLRRRPAKRRQVALRREAQEQVRARVSFTIPVMSPPFRRVRGRICVVGRRDMVVFRKLRQVFPGLSAWRPESATTASELCDGLASSTLALDLGGENEVVRLLAAKFGVASVGVKGSAHQEELFPELTLDHPATTLAAQKARWMLTDPVDVAAVCLRAKTRLAAHPGIIACRHGRMLANPRDIFIGRSLIAYGEFAELEIALLRRFLRRGCTVVDAGANIGTHTLAFAAMVGRRGLVYAFEPQRRIFETLAANLVLNDVANVRAHHAALSVRAGVLQVPEFDRTQTHNFGGVSVGSAKRGKSVTATSLDALRLAACHLIKIDVEGMEREVLEGARRTIRRCRPLLYVENDRLRHSRALIEHIQALGYRLWAHTPPLFSRKNFLRNRTDIFPNIVCANMLCVPRELDCRIRRLREIRSATNAILA